uniref:FAR1 domain-containing protein n=1 Tax=Lactuca sativa TaxID=4236 RepID=A0A9R1V5H5_LACSA|nr:hypothetical protein LSAT_V11C600326850 [Lactuca sativa]
MSIVDVSEDVEHSIHQILNYMDEDFENSKLNTYQCINMFSIFDHTSECSSSCNHVNSSCRTSSSCVSNFYMSEVLHYIKPDVPEEFKPTKAIRFKDVDEGVKIYKRYAEKAGFDVHLNTLRKVGDIIKHTFLVCNRIGKPKLNPTERNTIYRVTDCKAKIIVKRVKGTSDYRFDKFQENHSHELQDTFHLKSTRTLSYSDKEFIVRAFTAKMGGFQYLRGKVVDYINFKRSMGSINGFRDAQLIVNKMNNRKNNYLNYSLFYRCDETNFLHEIFWADETDKSYYTKFRDVMSFNAMFRTNKYALVFVPFTVIDHHKSSFTIVVGLLSTIVHVAYQEEIAKKLSVEFLKSTDFKKKFNKLFWDIYIERHIFERSWKLLMKEFNLEDEK